MVEGIGDGAVTVSVIGNPVPANPIPESEMDALLLGRTKVSCKHHMLSVLCDVCARCDMMYDGSTVVRILPMYVHICIGCVTFEAVEGHATNKTNSTFSRRKHICIHIPMSIEFICGPSIHEYAFVIFIFVYLLSGIHQMNLKE